MSIVELLLGRPLRSGDQESQRIGVLAAIPILGLDALASAAYGPEAALTVLLPAGGSALGWIIPITAVIVVVLALVGVSYAQTIPAYPSGGGSFTVAKENLGQRLGLIAAAALCTDYVLNVAVAVSAGIGAITSAVPSLLPWTLPLCLGVLALLTLVNLRGVREAGLVFVAPAYLFVVSLFATLAVGAFRAVGNHGHPLPVTAPTHLAPAASAVGLWLIARAFASGCTALTGVEAVSNAVPLFREPRVKHARRTLGAILAILVVLLAGVALLVHAYHIGATPPGKEGYQSVLSQLVGAVFGRGWAYFVTMAAVFSVLALSANTSFAGFPRVCRLLALDEYLPASYAHRGRRLVYSQGIVTLAVLSAALLAAFGGVTDRLIPLFAVGAFLAFTLSQAGMVAHWRRQRGKRSRLSMTLNGAGAAATGATLVIIVLAKFTEGAWVSLLVVGALFALFAALRRRSDRIWRERSDPAPLDLSRLHRPIVVVPLVRLDKVAHKGLRFALSLSDDVRAVQVITEELKTDSDLERRWPQLVEAPARAAGFTPPRLVVVPSEYRQFFQPFLAWLRELSRSEPHRPIAVLVPELVRRRWYHFFARSRATLLKALLLLEGGPQISVIDTPWYLDEEIAGTVSARRRWRRLLSPRASET